MHAFGWLIRHPEVIQVFHGYGTGTIPRAHARGCRTFHEAGPELACASELLIGVTLILSSGRAAGSVQPLPKSKQECSWGVRISKIYKSGRPGLQEFVEIIRIVTVMGVAERWARGAPDVLWYEGVSSVHYQCGGLGPETPYLFIPVYTNLTSSAFHESAESYSSIGANL
jgi:hypothetical protein